MTLWTKIIPIHLRKPASEFQSETISPWDTIGTERQRGSEIQNQQSKFYMHAMK